jgi:hypothetical protein
MLTAILIYAYSKVVLIVPMLGNSLTPIDGPLTIVVCVSVSCRDVPEACAISRKWLPHQRIEDRGTFWSEKSEILSISVRDRFLRDQGERPAVDTGLGPERTEKEDQHRASPTPD